MALTPEEQATLDALQARATEPDSPGEVAEAVAVAVSCVASDVASAVEAGESRELYAAQERADRAETRVTELESQVQEANDRLASMAEVTIVAGALETVSEEPDPVVVEVPSSAELPVTEVADDTPEDSPVEDEKPRPRRRGLYGRR
jgi:hypothetical protein